MLARVSSTAASSAGHPRGHHRADRFGFLRLLDRKHPLGVEPVGAVRLALLLLEVDACLEQLGLVPTQHRPARRQQRVQLVVLEDGQNVPLFHPGPLLDQHPLDPSGDLGADQGLVP